MYLDTCNDMNEQPGRPGVGSNTGVVAGVVDRCPCNGQPTLGRLIPRRRFLCRMSAPKEQNSYLDQKDHNKRRDQKKGSQSGGEKHLEI